MGEIGPGRAVEYQPGEDEWATLVKRIGDIVKYGSSQGRGDGLAEVKWKSDELQKKFVLTRRPVVHDPRQEGWHYSLSIMELSPSSKGDSIIALRDNEPGITAVVGSILEDADAGLSEDPMENAELLLRLYLSSYTMDSDV